MVGIEVENIVLYYKEIGFILLNYQTRISLGYLYYNLLIINSLNNLGLTIKNLQLPICSICLVIHTKKLIIMSFVKHYSNFQNKPVFSNVLENLFGRDVITNFIGKEIYNMPPANIVETKTYFRVDLLAAGFQKDNFKVQVIENQLVISVATETDETVPKERFVRQEFSQIDFKRAFTLPNSVQLENMEAKYSNGVLSITIPKMVIRPYNEEKGISVEIL